MRVTASLSGAFAQLAEGAVTYRVQHAAPFLSAVLAHVLNCSVKAVLHANSGAALQLIPRCRCQVAWAPTGASMPATSLARALTALT